MRCYSLVAALMLAGCATAPLPKVQTVTVNVAVPTPCIAAADVPTIPAHKPASAGSDTRDLLDLALEKLAAWEVFGARAVPLLDACSKIAPVGAPPVAPATTPAK